MGIFIFSLLQQQQSMCFSIFRFVFILSLSEVSCFTLLYIEHVYSVLKALSMSSFLGSFLQVQNLFCHSGPHHLFYIVVICVSFL